MAVSASFNRRSENVIVHPVVIAELEFCDVQRQILGADLVERADDTALKDAPETFNRLGVNGTDDVLSLRMIDGRVREFYAQLIVANPLISVHRAS